MLVAHQSDNHSYFVNLPKEAELIICSGDFLPNCSRGNLKKELNFQTNWLISKRETIKEWLDGRPFLFCAGNHDFIDNICEILNDGGIEAIDLTNKFVQYKGYSFYGFPFIPFLCGEWNYERVVMDMGDEIDRMIDRIDGKDLDILVAHCPPWGVLDQVGFEHIGNATLTNALNYGYRSFSPKWILCGHCHESGSQMAEIFGIKVSNAATTVHLLEI